LIELINGITENNRQEQRLPGERRCWIIQLARVYRLGLREATTFMSTKEEEDEQIYTVVGGVTKQIGAAYS